MRRYVGLNIFCALLTLAFSGASLAAEGAAEYRAPITGAKLGPVQPAQPAPSAAPGQTAVDNSAAPQQSNQWAGQQAAGGGASAPTPPAALGQPTPWSSGGMAPYSSFGSAPGAASGATPGVTAGSRSASGAGTAGIPQPTPTPGSGYAPGYTPYAAPGAGWQGQDGAVLSGTGQTENPSDNDRGIATQYRDPQTGDIITSVVPPSPPEQQNYGTFFIAPQIYPDGNQWGGNTGGTMPRPGQQYMPPVMWQPGMQIDNNKRRHDKKHHDRRSDDRYSSRPGNEGDSPYDQRGTERDREGRERR